MLKFMSSSYRCLGVSAEQINNELSLNILFLTSKKIFNAAFVIKKRTYQITNLCSLRTKSIIPVIARTHSSTSLHVLREKVTTEAYVSSKMSQGNHPDVNHASCGGVFQVYPDQIQRGVRNSSSGGENSPEFIHHQNSSNIIPGDFRKWEPVNKRKGSDGTTLKFKLLSYNVLAQYLLEWHPYLYRDCPTHCLKWKFRSSLILDEITNVAPDIICLQEVQRSHLATFYKKLEEIGYKGIFKQKTGYRQDGCAIYFKSSLFDLKDHISVEFFQPELPILDRDNIGLILKLIPRSMPDSPFIVATTHLLFNPKRTDVRLAQLQVFLAEIDRFSFSSRTGRAHTPIILTGDLNSLPNSAVINLLSYGNIHASNYREGSDWKKIGVTDNCQHLAVYLSRQRGETKRIDSKNLMIHHTQTPEHRLVEAPSIQRAVEDNSELFNSDYVFHSLNLKSAYDFVKYNGETEASTFQNQWVTVDYIFYSHLNRLNLLERLYLPTARECQTLCCLPNDVYGSDHLSLGAVFELHPTKSMS